MKHGKTLLVLLLIVVTAAGCAPAPEPGPVPGATVEEGGLVLPAGYTVRTVVEGLSGPTQMIQGPNGLLWIAQLAGGENEGLGEVVAIDVETDERRVVVDGLLKPTGIAIAGGYLWIATKRDLVRAPLDEQGNAGPIEVVLRDLPFNGRSNGTLTLTPHGDLLFETSGARFGGTPVEGSATLWQLDPAQPGQRRALATGLKGAYAHVYHGDNRLWVTEIADDPVNGAIPPDELNLVVEGADFGWPKCYGNREPARNYGGTAAECMFTRPPAMTFAPRSTPTSIVVSPWEPDTLLVTLWLQGTVAQVRVEYIDDSMGRNGVGTQETFIGGMRNPQHILVWDENTIFVSDHSRGLVYAVTRDEN